MSGRVALLSVVWIIGITLGACSPGLGKKLRIDKISGAEALPVSSGLASAPTLRVGTFEDRRPYTEVGEIDGRLLQPEGNVALNVQVALEDLLRAQGAQISQFSGPALVGQILEWRVTVVPGFPTTTVKGTASVKVELRDEVYAVLYTATYSGSAEAQHPIMSQAKVEKVLADAMSTALSGVIEDRELLGRLR